jgi:hypothetical protein
MPDLLPIENINAIELFSDKDKLDGLLQKIDKEARSHVLDASTAKGRKEITSLAYKVSQSKSYLEKAGKSTVEDAKKRIKLIDNERKRARDFLENLRDDIRQPVTEWEEAEEMRIQKHTNGIEAINSLAMQAKDGIYDVPRETLDSLLNHVTKIEIGPHWDEFEDEAREARENSISTIKECIDRRDQRDKEQAELERLRQAEQERLEKEREEQIRQEAAEQAKREAEAEAKREQERLEREKAEAIQAQQEAEKRAEMAAEAERQRIEDEQRKAKAEEERRERDKTHRKAYNNDALNALIEGGVSKTAAKQAITLIAQGKIPHVLIRY